MNLSILYRGPLSSCNYGCPYCPFAKHSESKAEHENDRNALSKFVNFIVSRTNDRLSVLFTPWGEALIHERYQKAMIEMTQQNHVDKVAIQTNLSCKLSWTEECDKSKLALWATYHPGEVSSERFLASCEELLERNVRFSVGVVGLKENFVAVSNLRQRLPREVYVWVNAFKREDNYYSPDDILFLSSVDPLFAWNNRYHSSLGKSCRAGVDVLSVDGDGVVRRCHFIKDPIGNIYDENFESCLKERPCTNNVCGCHIGYVHLDELQLQHVYGSGLLERIPTQWPNADFYPQPQSVLGLD